MPNFLFHWLFYIRPVSPFYGWTTSIRFLNFLSCSSYDRSQTNTKSACFEYCRWMTTGNMFTLRNCPKHFHINLLKTSAGWGSNYKSLSWRPEVLLSTKNKWLNSKLQKKCKKRKLVHYCYLVTKCPVSLFRCNWSDWQWVEYSHDCSLLH